MRWPPSLLLGVCVLTVAAAAAAFISFTTPTGGNSKRLADLIPATTGAWQSTELKVGETEFLRDAVERTLRYDDVVYREYRKGSETFALYIAYWKPGKTAMREVAFHTPDHCWVNNGWALREKRRLDANVAGSRFPGARRRVFEVAGQPQHVFYWHLADGKGIEYGGAAPSDWTLITDLFTKGLRLRREQYFIRFSSPATLERLFEDSEFAELLRGIGDVVIPRDRS